MPEQGKPLVFKYQLPDSCGTGARFAGYWVNSQKRIVNPTHYAVLRMPDQKISGKTEQEAIDDLLKKDEGEPK